MKPAHEPIVLARKPLSEKTIVKNVLKYNTGAINIDESRVATSDKLGPGGNLMKESDPNAKGFGTKTIKNNEFKMI